MIYKTDNLYLYVEGIQFINGLYETTKDTEIETLKRYSDSIDVAIEEEKPSKGKKTEE